MVLNYKLNEKIKQSCDTIKYICKRFAKKPNHYLINWIFYFFFVS